MSGDGKLQVVLYWHMHQPEYKDVLSGQYRLPWTYLHVIKDYVDMAAHLENCPTAKAVVNFTPTLLEQVDDYAQQIQSYESSGALIKDEMLELLVQPVLPVSKDKRLEIILNCLRANEERLIQRYPNYHWLAEQARFLEQKPHTLIYLHDQYLIDLLVWFHLAWMGETVKQSDRRIQALLEKAHDFTLQDRKTLLQVIGELCTNVIARYRQLAERGQVELSFTPYAHPIMPLLFGFESTLEAMPDAPLPDTSSYPGGAERVDWHIRKGIDVFEHYFGVRPKGCWPSEGSVCEKTVEALSGYGIQWLASGETVLRNSLSGIEAPDCIHQGYQLRDLPIRCFFRDDGLSDMIGFNYSQWHADDAVANLVHHLENIADVCDKGGNSIVSIILDGENAWEFYPENGYHFLSALYRELSDHPSVNLTTYETYLEKRGVAQELGKIVAGSWVYGTFSTWIGSEDKNTGWDMLCEAKLKVDSVLNQKNFTDQQVQDIETQLAICEGSDWFWWFGDYNPSESVRDFEYLFRLQLSELYSLLGETPPANLSESFTHGTGHPSVGGTMRPGKEF